MYDEWIIGLPLGKAPWLEALVRGVPAGLAARQLSDLFVPVAVLGECGDEQADNAWELAVGESAFSVTLGQVVSLGPDRRPEAFAVMLDEAEELTEFLWRVGPALCTAAAAPPDRQPDMAHIVVAQPFPEATRAQLREMRAWADNSPALHGRIQLEEIALYTSSSLDSGPLYRIVERRPLGIIG